MSTFNLRKWALDSLCTGAISGVATTLGVAACGRMEDRRALAPLNAVSHIAWGDEAARRTGWSWKYTFTGILLNLVAVTGWAAVYHLLFDRAIKKREIAVAVLGGPIVSAAAYITDYKIVPKRFTPGFEKRLSSKSMFCVYATLAAALAAGAICSVSKK
jgi:hypothetical protein